MDRAERKALMNQIIGDWVNNGSHDPTELSRMLSEAGLMVTANSADEAFDLLNAGAVSVHIGSDEQDEPTDPDPAAPGLYNVYTKVNNWEKSGKPITFNWFYEGKRTEPTIPYADVIRDWQPTAGDERNYTIEENAPAPIGYAEDYIDSLFTLDEAMQLVRWLAQHRPGTHKVVRLDLPTDRNVMSVGSLPVGGTDDFHMLAKAEDYDLPFTVWGYYNYEHIHNDYLQVDVTVSADGAKTNVTPMRAYADDPEHPVVRTISSDIDDIPF